MIGQAAVLQKTWSTTALAAALLALGMGSALAAPSTRTPGVPFENNPIFVEDFENPQTDPGTGQALSLGEYQSATKDVNGNPLQYTAAGVAYTGSPAIAGMRTDPPDVPFWLNKNFCNGMWLNSTKAAPTGNLSDSEYDPGGTKVDNNDLAYCMGTFSGKLNNAWGALQNLAKVFGQKANGGNATDAVNANNHVIAAYTVTRNNRNDPQASLVQLQMAQPIPLPSGGRFITFSVAMAATSCKNTAVDPNIDFYLIKDVTGNKTDFSASNSNLIKLNSASANPCKEAQPFVGSIYVSQTYGDKPVLYTGGSVAMQFVNNSSGTNGNDGAFDNLKILDLTPALDKAFSATSPIGNGAITQLTFTITNTVELAQKTGWSFSDTLPVGMTVAGPTSAISCDVGTSTGTLINAPVGGNSIVVTAGDLPAGASSCTISVPVKVTLPSPMVSAQDLSNGPLSGGTAGTPGTTDTFALIPPETAIVKVLPSVDLLAVPAPSQSVTQGTPVTFNTSCTNAGPDVALGATCAVPSTGIPADATDVVTTCTPSSSPALDLRPGQSITCTTTFTPHTTGSVRLDTVASTSGSMDINPANDIAPTLLVLTPTADMQLTSPGPITAKVGEPVTVTSICINAGPSPAVNATCTVTGAPAGATTVCTPTPPITPALAVNTPISCETKFTPTTAGTVTLKTVATSDTPDPVPTNNSGETKVTTPEPQADLQVSTPTSITGKIGEPVKVTSTCTNLGPDAAEAADCQVSGAPTGATTVCTPQTPVKSLAFGSAISCTVSWTPTTDGTTTLVTTATSTTSDPVKSNNVGDTPVKVTPPQADMQATAPTTLTTTPGVEATLVSTCTNAGPDIAENATCTVTGAPDGAVTSCQPASPVTSLAVGANMVCETKFTPKDASIFTITTTAASTTEDPDLSNNVAKTVDPSTPVAGPAPVPTLGEWALLLLASLVGGVAALRLRRSGSKA